LGSIARLYSHGVCTSQHWCFGRLQDVRATEIAQVEMYASFRPGDVVKAEVLSLGDSRSVRLAELTLAAFCLQPSLRTPIECLNSAALPLLVRAFLGTARSYYLSTAKNELGVVYAKAAVSGVYVRLSGSPSDVVDRLFVLLGMAYAMATVCLPACPSVRPSICLSVGLSISPRLAMATLHWGINAIDQGAGGDAQQNMLLFSFLRYQLWCVFMLLCKNEGNENSRSDSSHCWAS
jgi:Exosome component EXOSC1/CSL4